MELRQTTAMILGGSGLVGRAVARRFLALEPAKLVIVALTEAEVRRTAEVLEPNRGEVPLEFAWGNVFLPAALRRLGMTAATRDLEARRRIVDDLLGDLTDEVLQRSFLFQLLATHRPRVVVDCINTATAFAYRDPFRSARRLREAAEAGRADRALVEEHLLTVPVPNLIRHVQILVEGLKQAGTKAYVKIGTSGTGGMGFNVPYTHSEERPSRMLLAKSATAGAHSLLLFLMGRTPGAPATIEVKPTATIGWREIAYGPIRRGGLPVPLDDCPTPITLDAAFADDATVWRDTGRTLESVYVDMGENGVFARDEFETVTALGQMESVTPEEIADLVVMELEGRPTGRDVVAALDAATLGPTYRAGVLRQKAIDRLRALEAAHGVRSVAFEQLGPPRLTKLLYEAFILSRIAPSIEALANGDVQALARSATCLIEEDGDLRARVISVGLPVMLPDGRVYRGRLVVVPPDGGADAAARRGWVDLRPANMAGWVDRATRMVAAARERETRPPSSGSEVDWFALDPADPIEPSRMATWVFRVEDGGERMKR